ncbi:MAG: RNA polymerase sigma factor [Verrucomicrobiota bacterium]
MNSEESLNQLVAEAASGDEAAFRVIIEKFKGRVLGTASRFAWQKHDLDDLAQEVFIRIWKGLPQYRAEAPFEHWVMRVTVRTCYDFARKQKRKRLHEEEWDPTGPDMERVCHLTQEELERGEAGETLRFWLHQLAPEDRTVLILLELEQQSVDEISRHLQWSRSKVKTRAHRARNKLKALMRKERV